MKRLLFIPLLLLALSVGAQSILRASSFYVAPAVAGGGSTLLNGIVAYWNGEEASGDAIDQVGSADGVCTSITYQVAGIVDYGYGFSEASDVITVGDVAALELTTFSASIWAKVPGDWKALISCADNPATDDGWGIRYNNNRPEFEIMTPTAGQVIANAVDLTDNAFHHIVVTYDKVTMLIYIDGAKQTDEQALSTTISYVGTSFMIGDFYDEGNNFGTGPLDEIGIWNRALNQTEVTELYNSGAGITYPFTP